MHDRNACFTNMIFLATCLAVGCTGGGSLGCGSSDDAGGATVDSELPGIYTLDQYQQSEGSCDMLMDVDPAPSRLLVYGIPSTNNPDKGVLIGRFCGSVADCQQKANEDRPSVVPYSFLQGSDAAGWQGWGIASEGAAGDQCLAEVQAHTMTSTREGAIRIDTRQVEVDYPPSDPGSVTATCTVRGAIDAIDDESPCTKVFLLEATFEAAL